MDAARSSSAPLGPITCIITAIPMQPNLRKTASPHNSTLGTYTVRSIPKTSYPRIQPVEVGDRNSGQAGIRQGFDYRRPPGRRSPCTLALRPQSASDVRVSIGLHIAFLPRAHDGSVASDEAFSELAELREALTVLNVVLQRKGLPEYVEPEVVASPYKRGRLGRSSVDHTGSTSLRQLPLFGKTRKQLMLLRDVDQLIFHPAAFDDRPECTLPPNDQRTTLGSTPRLIEELVEMAPNLGIPLDNGSLSDKVAKKIADMKRLQLDKGLDAEAEMLEWPQLASSFRGHAARGGKEVCAGPSSRGFRSSRPDRARLRVRKDEPRSRRGASFEQRHRWARGSRRKGSVRWSSEASRPSENSFTPLTRPFSVKHPDRLRLSSVVYSRYTLSSSECFTEELLRESHKRVLRWPASVPVPADGVFVGERFRVYGAPGRPRLARLHPGKTTFGGRSIERRHTQSEVYSSQTRSPAHWYRS